MTRRSPADNLLRVLSDGRARLIPPGGLSGAGSAPHGPSPQEMEALRQSGRRVERIPATPRPRSGQARSVDVTLQQAAALDQLFTAPGAGQATTLRAVFVAMRDHGVQPHGRPPEQDAVVAAELLSVIDGSGDHHSTRPQTPNSLNEPEAGTGPSPWFGVAEPAMPKTASGELKFGTYAQIVADLRDMGAGAVRRCKGRDVYWGSVFPIEGGFGRWDNGEQVPPPDALLTALQSDDYASLGYFAELLLACRLAGLEFDITPFDPGGGSGLNIHSPADADGNDDRDPLMVPGADGKTWEPLANGWRELLLSAPSWQEGVRVPSTRGWHEFYWSHGSPTEAQQHFQRFAIQVWPTVDPAGVAELEGLDAGFTDSYVRECARRKSLAVAAFSHGVAEMLTHTHLAWQRCFDVDGIYAVVKTVELGNEHNGQYRYHPATDSSADLAASHREAGRYMALVASPFRWKLPRMRYRAPELSSWQPYERSDEDRDCSPSAGCCVADDYGDRVQWLHGAIGTGVVLAWEQERSNQLWVASWLSGDGAIVLPVSVQEWFITCATTGYFWPPLAHDTSETLSFAATELVHDVGFHWFHGNNRKFLYEEVGPELWIPGYQDAIRLQQDIDALRTGVVEPLAEEGFQLSTTLGAVAFDAVQPDPVETRPISAWYYQGTNPLLQAGLLARYLFHCRTAGVQRMSWFCPLAGTIGVDADGIIAEWEGDFIGTGLHNDLAREGEDGAFAARAAWRRPAWFTWRRVAWLLSLAEDAGNRAHNHRGLTVLRFRLSTPLAVDSSGMRLAGEGHRYLWIVWLDQYADSECLHAAHLEGEAPWPGSSVGSSERTVLLGDAQGRGYRLLSLVPQVIESSDPTLTDANGYRQVSARDWTWYGWDGAILEQDEVAPADLTLGSAWAEGMTSIIRLRIRKADGVDAPAPIALLTDADQLRSIDFGVDTGAGHAFLSTGPTPLE